jgi:sulfite reductase (NADPH) hemoprotein beta-component
MAFNEAGEIGFEVLVGGGLGRTPVIGQTINSFIKEKDILSYLEAILRVYNRFGRRDNKYKARIKILVRQTGLDVFKEQVEEEWDRIKDGPLKLTQAQIDRIKDQFSDQDYRTDAPSNSLDDALSKDNAFKLWFTQNTQEHKQPGYRIVFISLKSPNRAPGDITDKQMDAVADLAENVSFGEIRSTHDQNLALTEVHQDGLYDLWRQLHELDLATPNIGTITDMICCPGLDFCSLANASSIDISQNITQRFQDDAVSLGDISIKMSGCMNGCGHHSIGEIGILGVDKKGEQWYQLTLGGSDSEASKLGERLGRAIAKDKVTDVVEDIVKVYKENKENDETFIKTFERVGIKPFKERIYGSR